MADGLPAQTVSSIVEDRHGHIWLATTKGVARIRPETFAVETFSIEHGFAGSTYNRNATLADSKGQLYFGSTEGITAFYPVEIQRGVCLLIIDIDHFKRINDTRGHDAGDRIINGVARILRQTVRKGDHVGRWDGEEFVILCAGATRQGAESVAKKICASVADCLFERELQPLHLTISIGVTMSKENEPFEMTLKHADELLYKAKESGRDCVVIED